MTAPCGRVVCYSHVLQFDRLNTIQYIYLRENRGLGETGLCSSRSDQFPAKSLAITDTPRGTGKRMELSRKQFSSAADISCESHGKIACAPNGARVLRHQRHGQRWPRNPELPLAREFACHARFQSPLPLVRRTSQHPSRRQRRMQSRMTGMSTGHCLRLATPSMQANGS